MTTPDPDDLIRRLTGDNPDEAIRAALIDIIRRLERIEERLEGIDRDLGEIG
jgi:hypothetical protein